MRPEAFDLVVNSVGENNVDAYGPVHGLAGTDTEFAPFFGRWQFPNGDTVNVLHQAEGAPVLDLNTCTALVVIRDGWWRFAGGTGGDAGARGHGLFTEEALFSFAIDRHGRCEFDTRGQMVDRGGSASYGDQPYMRDHGRNLRPVFFSVEVQGTGTASVRHHEDCPPVYVAPTAAPNGTGGNDHGACQPGQNPNANPTPSQFVTPAATVTPAPAST